MRICVWRTNHAIADTVGKAVWEGLDGADIRPTSQARHAADYDLNIVYGILRGADEVFRRSRSYIHLDRGYWGADHFGGRYRVSLGGTQQTKFWPEPVAHGLDLKPWRGFDNSKPVLVCPPTQAVKEFFSWPGFDEHDERSSLKRIYPNIVARHKGDPTPLNFDDYNYVMTFNSSVGWQAIQAGIPCVSDTTHSMVGSFFHNILLANLSEAQYSHRERLFGCMSALQMTLDEIRGGKLWQLVSKSFTSVMMTGNPPPVSWPRTPSGSAPDKNQQ